jgi:hypothetical protein
MAVDLPTPLENMPAQNTPDPAANVVRHPNGRKRAEGRYAEGKEEGPWTYWDADGQLEAAGEYRNGLREGLWTEWYPNGQKRQEGEYRQGNRHGAARSWYASGKPRMECHYCHGALHGPWTDWTEAGAVRGQTQFVHGIPLGHGFRGDPDDAPARIGRWGYLFWGALLGITALAVYRETFLLLAVLFFLFGVTIHEFGHFLAAKLVGIPIQRFRVGIGPRLWRRQVGSTHYEVHLCPVFGFVQPYWLRPGELAQYRAARAAWRRGQALPPDPEASDAASQSAVAFVARSLQIIFFFAGPAFNFLAAVVALWGFLQLDSHGVPVQAGSWVVNQATPLSAGDAALEAPRVAARLAWDITRILPVAVLQSLNPRNLTEPGALAGISEGIGKQARTRPTSRPTRLLPLAYGGPCSCTWRCST